MNKYLDELIRFYVNFYGKEAKTVLDVGSRDGLDLLYLLTRVGASDATGVAIEARAAGVKEIENLFSQASFVNEQNLIVKPVAVSNFIGEAEFVEIVNDDPVTGKDHEGSSSFDKRRVNNREGIKNIITVPVVTLAQLIQDLQADGWNEEIIEIIKIDIEGYSLEALEGLGEWLEKTVFLHVETELPGEALKNTNNDVKQFMEAKGFHLLATQYEWANLEDQIWFNLRFKK